MSLKKTAFLSASIVALSAAPAAHAQLIIQEPDQIGDVIVVTASPLGLTVDETIVGTTVVGKEDLARYFQTTVAETISRVPGVSSTYFGPAASRPIIRGLGDDRVRVLNNGIGSIDASVASPDHAVSIDPASADQIEIIRGPATLLYGSSAAGGVVNIISGQIPTTSPEDGFAGSVTFGASSADEGFDGAADFDLQLAELGNGALVLHADGFYREASDYEIPGFAESAIFRAAEEAEEAEEGGDGDEEEEEEEVFGKLPNSFFETSGATVGVSFVGTAASLACR